MMANNINDLNALLPKDWSAWKLEESIGGRGHITVYKAIREDEAGTSYSAIKVIRVPDNIDKTQYIEEIKFMLSLKQHPNIVSIEDYATVSQNGYNYIFIRMELLTPLDLFVAANDFGEAETIQLGIEICNALEYCKRKGTLHLDIKPSNIFVTDDGHYKLGDFGISLSIVDKSTIPVTGYTRNFMGPELYPFIKDQISTEVITISSDILDCRYDQYSLGLVLYWIRNNRKPPFLPDRIVTKQDEEEAFRRRMIGESLPPLNNTSSGLAKIIYKACSYKPDDRYSGPSAMRSALEALQTSSKQTLSQKHIH